MSLVVDAAVRRGAFTLAAKFEVPARGVTAVFGPSGAGKSMLLGAIAGLQRLDAGRVALGARVLEDAGGGVRAPAHTRGVGLVFQDARLFPHLSVRGNLLYAQRRAPVGRALFSLAEAAACFDIETLLDRAPRRLSGGEKSRVALARALLAAPDLLLLDEPFAALDGPRRQAFITVLRDVCARFALPMLVVTHQIDDAAALADHVIALEAGRVIAAGPFAETTAGAAFQRLLDPRDSGAALALGAPETRYVWARANHVLLANQQPAGLSARHVWRCRIAEIIAEEGGAAMVLLDAPQGPLRARVTAAAAAGLQLAPGGEAWAIVKAHAL